MPLLRTNRFRTAFTDRRSAVCSLILSAFMLPSGPTKASVQVLDESTFWSIVEEAARTASKSRIDHSSALERVLMRHSPGEIVAFERALYRAKLPLQTSVIVAAAELARTRVSDDSLEYFQWWIIMQGRVRYQKTLHNPDSLAELLDKGADPLWWQVESLGVGAHDAYLAKTGREMSADFPRSWEESRATTRIQDDLPTSHFLKSLPRLTAYSKRKRGTSSN